MDKGQLLDIFFAQLSDEIGASSGKTPAPISRKNKDSSTSNKKQKHQAAELQQDLVNNVAKLQESVSAVAASSIQAQIDHCDDKIFKLNTSKFLTANITEEHIELIDAQIEKIKASKKTLEERLESVDSKPKALTYEMEN